MSKMSGKMSTSKIEMAPGWFGPEVAKYLKSKVKKVDNQERIAQAVGITRQSLHAILSGKSVPRPETMQKICDLVGLDSGAFFRGEVSRDLGVLRNEEFNPTFTEIDPAEYVLIPYFGGTLSAGDGAYLSNEAGALEALPFPRNRLKARAHDIKQVHLLSVKGESMSPTVRDGDLVLVDLSNREPNDGIFALQHTDTLYLKRLRFLNDGKNVLIESDNPSARGNDLGVIPLDDVDFTLIGRAIYTITEPSTL